MSDPAVRSNKSLFLGFVLVGALGFATDAGLLAAGLAIGFPPAVARAISVCVALQVTFALNGLFVFRTLEKRTFPRQWIAYIASNGLGAACNYLIYVALIASGLPLLSNRIPAFVLAAVIALMFNFAGARLVAFRRMGT